MFSQRIVDPQNVSRAPISRMSQNFKAAKVHQVNSDKLVLKHSSTMILTIMAFVVFFGIMVLPRLNFQDSISFDALSMIHILPLFILVIPLISFVKLLSHKTVFDKSSQTVKSRASGKFSLQSEVRNLHSVVALQLISTYASRKMSARSSANSSYGGYETAELNLVFQDGQRLNINNGGSSLNMKNDAILIAQFLNVPIWEM